MEGIFVLYKKRKKKGHPTPTPTPKINLLLLPCLDAIQKRAVRLIDDSTLTDPGIEKHLQKLKYVKSIKFLIGKYSAVSMA